MGSTITLPEPLTNQLEQQALRLHISIDELAARLLSAALKDEPIDLSRIDLDDIDHEEDFPPLEEVVARIKALPPNPSQIEIGEKVGNIAYLDYLLANPPQDTMTFDEWEQFWPPFEQELKKLDELNSVA